MPSLRSRIEALEQRVGPAGDADRRPLTHDERVQLYYDAVAKAEAEAAAGEPSHWAASILILRDMVESGELTAFLTEL